MRSLNSIAISRSAIARLEVQPEAARLAEVDVADLVALVGVVVHQHADDARQRPGHRPSRCAHSSGTVLKPMRARRPPGTRRRGPACSVKMQLTTSSGVERVALEDLLHQDSVVVEDVRRPRCASTVVAPRRANRRMAGGIMSVARAGAATSAGVSRRACPRAGACPSRSGPKAIALELLHRWPTASHMRRTWRLRPSWIVMLELVGRAAGARAPGAVMPSSSSTPVAQRVQRAPRGPAAWRPVAR